MSRTKQELDLVLSIGGKGALKGALTPEDLEDLADLMKGLKAFDPSLQNIQMIGSIKKGSALAGFVAPQPEGLPNIHPARAAARCYFDNAGYEPNQGWTWNKPQRTALGRLTSRGCTLGVNVPPSHPDEPVFKACFDRKSYQEFAKHIATVPVWQTIRGKLLELDYKDRTFEIHTANGVMTCPFPVEYAEDRFDDLARKVVVSEVFCRHRPIHGTWKADACKTVLLAPQEDPWVREAYPPGIRPPSRPMTGGFHLDQFAPSLDAAAGESLASFLKVFEGE